MVGQSAVLGSLRNQVATGRVAHAYLFCGSRGTGKTSTAKILAKAINCEHPENGDPCGVCDNCRRMELDESLDVIEIDAASNNGVDEIRDLRDTVKYPPQYGKYKVYIIDEVHMLSTSAFNALLKTLEEPPAYIVFILATTEPQKLPETILSRCQRFDFGRLSVSDIQGRLAEAVAGTGAEATPGALMRIARAAEGGMRDAFSMLDMCLGYGRKVDEELVREILGTSDRSFLFRFAEAIGSENISGALEMISELIRTGRDPAVFAKEMSAHFRALLIAKTCGERQEGFQEDITEEDYSDYLRQSGQFTVTRLMRIMELFMSLETEMRYASSPRLALENAVLKCIVRTQETDAQSLMDRIEELEKKLADLAENGIERAGGKGGKKKASPEGETSGSVSPTPAARTPVDPGRMPDLERELTAELRKRAPALPGILRFGTLQNVTDGTLIWRPKESPAASAYINSLNLAKNKQTIEGILKELTGEAISFRAEASGKAEKSDSGAAGQEEAHIRALINTFGEQPVDVVE